MFALMLATFLATEAPAVNGEMQALFDRAFALNGEQKWEESSAALKTLTAAGYRTPETGFAFRNAYEQLHGGVDGAIAKLEQEVRENPEDAVAHNALGVFYLAKGRREESRHEITRALQIAPDNLDHQLSLAFWYGFVGQSRAAIREYESIVAANPNVVDAQIELCRLISNAENDPRRALASCEKAFALKPSEALAVTVGTVQMRTGDMKGAEATLAKAVAANPEGTLAKRQLAVYAMQSGRPAEARATFEALLVKNPDDVESRIWLAKTWQAERSHANAIREYKLAYEKQGGGMLLGALARAYLQQYFYGVIFVLLAAMGLLLWRYLDVKTPDAPAPAV